MTYAWFNLTCYHPPRATSGTSPALRSRGWGIVWSRPVPGGGGGQIENNLYCQRSHRSVYKENTWWIRSLSSHTCVLYTSCCSALRLPYTLCAVLRAMADALQSAVHRPGAYQGAINAAQAVVPQVWATTGGRTCSTTGPTSKSSGRATWGFLLFPCLIVSVRLRVFPYVSARALVFLFFI